MDTFSLSEDSAGPRSDFEKNLAAVIASTGHERFRWLTSEENPDVAAREGYRRLVVSMATGQPIEPATPAPAEPTAADRQLQAYVVRHGCGGCG